MKKITFNDKYGLTEAVLHGIKTMTRMLVPQSILDKVEQYQQEYYEGTLDALTEQEAILNMVTGERMLRTAYRVDEVVAVAQSYEDTGLFDIYRGPEYTKGWNNKMFVRADLMPHQIRITNIKVERLQDISNTDCLKEGIILLKDWEKKIVLPFTYQNTNATFATGQMAFADLINRINGRGTWENNPWVIAYTFELLQ